MNEETKHQIGLTLELLRQILVDNSVSIGLDPDNQAILFFDTKAYCKSGKFEGTAAYIENLVK